MNEEYENRMQALLAEEYPAYEHSMAEAAYRGYRINPLKIQPAEFFQITGFSAQPTPFAANSYYLPKETGLGNSPAYAAGLFYMQEPSAGSAVTVLQPKPGMRILDLCAAPGSKTTQIAEAMDHQGLLVANDINASRAEILKENVERCGAANVMVLNADPREVAAAFPAVFDAVLCDAPCSGEGMFRKEPEAVKQWSLKNVLQCAVRQQLILEQAYLCLAPGGVLVYSTCTFSLDENEQNIHEFLLQHSDMKIEPAGVAFGRSGIALGSGTELARRIYPMDGGEGHFVCRLRKAGSGQPRILEKLKSERIPECAVEFLNQQLDRPYPYLYAHGGRIYGGSNPFVSAGRCRIVREQVLLGEERNGRFEPHHHLYASAWSHFRTQVQLDDSQAAAYLRGETLRLNTAKGYTAVCWQHYPLGFGKSDGSILKNKYPKQYRIH